MERVRRRIERSGFFLFFFGFLILALGLQQGVNEMIYAGLAILLLILMVVIGRSARDVMKPRRRPDAASAPPPSPSRSKRRPATHDPDNY